MQAFVKIGATFVPARSISENLVNGTGSTQDGTAAVWAWFWKYQVPSGNMLAFKARRDNRYAFAMTLKDAPTTVLPDAAELRLVVYYPDAITMKKIIWKGTYATIKNGTKYDLEKMVHANEDYDVQPDEWLYWEVYHASATLDVSEGSMDIGVTRWVPA